MQIICLGKQMYPHASRGFLQAYKSATERPYGYLLLDLRGTTRDCLRRRTGCLGEMTDKMERCYDVDKGGAVLYVLIAEKELKELRRQAAEGRREREGRENGLTETKVRPIEPKLKRKKRMIPF